MSFMQSHSYCKETMQAAEAFTKKSREQFFMPPPQGWQNIINLYILEHFLILCRTKTRWKRKQTWAPLIAEFSWTLALSAACRRTPFLLPLLHLSSRFLTSSASVMPVSSSTKEAHTSPISAKDGTWKGEVLGIMRPRDVWLTDKKLTSVEFCYFLFFFCTLQTLSVHPRCDCVASRAAD